MTVLILTEDVDVTVDPVIELLHGRGVPVLRCDTAWFPQRMGLDAEFRSGRWDGMLRAGQRLVPLSRLRTVWYRHPTAFSFPQQMSDAERRHATHEARLGLGGVLWSLPLRWVNHPARAADVYKPVQLAVAACCGLAVPDTLVTSEPAAVHRFVAAHPGGVVLKQLGFASIAEQGGRSPLYTRLLTPADLADLDGVQHTAHTFQQLIDKRHDARVIVVGRRVFTAALHTDDPAGRVDFRASYHTLTYTVVDPPGAVVAALERFMDHFGLAYAAFDFAVDHDQQWWFLECNPGGQYGFLEHHTGLPITQALAELLAGDK